MTYDYTCTACNHNWEAEHSINAEPLTDCPECKKPTAKRQISQGNFVLRGAGWYKDGYSGSK